MPHPGVKFLEYLSSGSTFPVRGSGVFTPILVIEFIVASGTTLIITKRGDNPLLCYAALFIFAAVTLFVCGCFVYALRKKDSLLRSDEYAAHESALMSDGRSIKIVKNSLKAKSTKTGSKNQ